MSKSQPSELFRSQCPSLDFQLHNIVGIMKQRRLANNLTYAQLSNFFYNLYDVRKLKQNWRQKQLYLDIRLFVTQYIYPLYSQDPSTQLFPRNKLEQKLQIALLNVKASHNDQLRFTSYLKSLQIQVVINAIKIRAHPSITQKSQIFIFNDNINQMEQQLTSLIFSSLFDKKHSLFSFKLQLRRKHTLRLLKRNIRVVNNLQLNNKSQDILNFKRRKMGNADAKLLLIGLDNSGKTTILSRLVNPGRYDPNITPTIGFNKNKFSRQGLDFQVFDMSGQSKYRDLWQANIGTGSASQKLDGIIFVVDSSDKMRINVARSQLQMILENQKISKSTPFLFYANKVDIKGSCNVKQVEQILKLKEFFVDRKYYIIGCCGVSGSGIQQGMNWLVQKIKPYKQ